MSIVRGENKIAVLLTSLPRAVAESVLARLGPERGGRLRGLMEQARAEVSQEVMDDVLSEFEEALSQATRNVPMRPRLAADTVPESDSYEPSARSGSEPASTSPPVDDAIVKLRLIDSDRLAAVLDGEHPRGVATVLSCLDATRAFEVLKRLPAEVRKEVFPRLGETTGGAGDVSLRIVRAVVAKSRAVAAAPEQPNIDDKAQMMAEILRSMERADRLELMGALTERDETLAAAVRERLYVFDDLAAIQGQSMQKLLAEIDSKTLATALNDAPENIVDNVMSNLSKRARESLTEEMSYLGSISAGQLQLARKVVVDVIQRMDQAGDLG